VALAILLSRANVTHGTGEPFGAAIFSGEDGQLVAVGMSQVVQQRTSVLHAEVMAIMMAEQRLQAYHLGCSGQRYELFSSCEPCAMCLDPHQHVVGKRRTQQLERKHLTLRTRIKRLVRKGICFSKSVEMHDLLICLFIHPFEFGLAV
jgi:deoxycytidylate deaminase